MLVSGAWAASEQVLYSFASPSGWGPQSALIFDGAGNLYGTTTSGGDYQACPAAGCGVVFELTPTSGGVWKETVLHTFRGTDGSAPWTGNLIFDGGGNLYGTTMAGGAHNLGVVFELTPNNGGGWTETVLHSFSGNDGEYPYAGVIMDGTGNLYGTTSLGGTHSGGVAFELMADSTGWKYKVLHSFNNHGRRPEAGLVLDPAGNLYGTTEFGGRVGSGLVFELTPNASGVWNEVVLYEFQGTRRAGKDGRYPGALIFDGQGSLYGTTILGGPHHNRGMIFKLTRSANGTWKRTVLQYGSRNGGYGFFSALTFDAAGNLYGTGGHGGRLDRGVVFRLTPTAIGFWTEKVLHSFGSTGDGATPEAGLIWDTAGNLYGTTVEGGTASDGTVFEITP